MAIADAILAEAAIHQRNRAGRKAAVQGAARGIGGSFERALDRARQTQAQRAQMDVQRGYLDLSRENSQRQADRDAAAALRSQRATGIAEAQSGLYGGEDPGLRALSEEARLRRQMDRRQQHVEMAKALEEQRRRRRESSLDIGAKEAQVRRLRAQAEEAERLQNMTPDQRAAEEADRVGTIRRAELTAAPAIDRWLDRFKTFGQGVKALGARGASASGEGEKIDDRFRAYMGVANRLGLRGSDLTQSVRAAMGMGSVQDPHRGVVDTMFDKWLDTVEWENLRSGGETPMPSMAEQAAKHREIESMVRQEAGGSDAPEDGDAGRMRYDGWKLRLQRGDPSVGDVQIDRGAADDLLMRALREEDEEMLDLLEAWGVY